MTPLLSAGRSIAVALCASACYARDEGAGEFTLRHLRETRTAARNSESWAQLQNPEPSQSTDGSANSSSRENEGAASPSSQANHCGAGDGVDDRSFCEPALDEEEVQELASRIEEAIVASDEGGTPRGNSQGRIITMSSGASDSPSKAPAIDRHVDPRIHEQQSASRGSQEGTTDEAGTESSARGKKQREVCGAGEYRKTCGRQEVCCNQSCGICAARGQTCLPMVCGGPGRGGASPKEPRSITCSKILRSILPAAPGLLIRLHKTYTRLETSEPASVRFRRQEIIIESLDKSPSTPLKDRLQDLRVRLPDLFSQVSLKGLKRLISQLSSEHDQLKALPTGRRDVTAIPSSAATARHKTARVPPQENTRTEQYHEYSTRGVPSHARARLPVAGADAQLTRTAEDDLSGRLEKSLTGLADVDIAATMEGMLDRKISPSMQAESDLLGRQRAEVIRQAMIRVWKGYTEHAWGYDEVKPIERKGNNNWGGMGVTLVDSLDTLWLMGLKDDFYAGRDWVRDHLTFENAGMVSVFETTIRVLGGLLSAFELSRDQVFLDRAKDLADRLMPAFTSPTGLPYKMVDLKTGKKGGDPTCILSEVGTLQLEFRYLSRALGDDHYSEKATKAVNFLSTKTPPRGLYPIRIDANTGEFIGTQISLGALGDSFYEYLLKVWLQGGRTETTYRRMYDSAMDGVTDTLLQKGRGLTFLTERNGGQPRPVMDHLVCFMAGNLALGALTSADADRRARDLWIGLSPESVDFSMSGDMRPRENGRFYVLRPETIESFFVLHQLTGDPVYREWGWDIFRAIERRCRVGVGYGSHPDVENPGREPRDHMESFFPGETLKYLYLLMQPDHPIDLMEYTLNTEAHPLKIFDEDAKARRA